MHSSETDTARLARYRDHAGQAECKARHAWRPLIRDSYRELAAHWQKLAARLECEVAFRATPPIPAALRRGRGQRIYHQIDDWNLGRRLG